MNYSSPVFQVKQYHHTQIFTFLKSPLVDLTLWINNEHFMLIVFQSVWVITHIYRMQHIMVPTPKIFCWFWKVSEITGINPPNYFEFIKSRRNYLPSDMLLKIWRKHMSRLLISAWSSLSYRTTELPKVLLCWFWKANRYILAEEFLNW